jgi:hypothetical protein
LNSKPTPEKEEIFKILADNPNGLKPEYTIEALNKLFTQEVSYLVTQYSKYLQL